MGEQLENLMLETVEDSKLRPEDEDALIKLLDDEYSSAQAFRSQFQTEMEDGMHYYLADRAHQRTMRTDSLATSSQMVSKDTQETTDNLIPDLMRVVLSNKEIVEFEAQTQQESGWVSEANIAVNQTLRAQPAFEDHLHDFIKDGLLKKIGLGQVVSLAPSMEPEVHKGVPRMELASVTGRPGVVDYEVLDDPGDGTLNLKLIKKTPWKVIVQALEPESLLVSAEARTLDQSNVKDGPRYTGKVESMTVAAAMQQWPEKDELWIKAAAQGRETADLDEVQMERHEAVLDFAAIRGELDDQPIDGNLLASNIEVKTEYYRVDLDDDNFPELIQFVRVGSVIIHREEVSNNPFFCWTPYRLQHHIIGESHFDKVKNIQDFKTSIFRATNDSLNVRVRPRIAYDHRAASQMDTPTMADIVRWESGAPIRVQGPPQNAIMPIELPDVSKSGLEMLDYADRMKDVWTGVSRRQMGLDPEAVSQESGTHLDKTLNANNGRKEQIARRLSYGIQDMGTKVLQELIRHGQGIEIQSAGEWRHVQPSSWYGNPTPIVHISGAVGSRDVESAYLQNMEESAYGFIERAGPNNPWIGYTQVANIIAEKIKTFGFKNPERFISSPDQQIIKDFNTELQNQKPPEVQVAEMENQTKQAEISAEAAKDKYRLDTDKNTKRIEADARAKVDMAKVKSQEEIAKAQDSTKRYEIEMRAKIEREKMESAEKTAKMQADAARAAGGNQSDGSGARA